MANSPVKKLEVWRTFSDASRCLLGVMAQNKQGVYFQYQPDYLARFSNLSPFNLTFDGTLQLAPRTPHHGLQGVFADSLPDGWGLMLMDRLFRRSGILPAQITAMDRLAFVGNSGLGGLSYELASTLKADTSLEKLRIADLGVQAQALFDGQTTDVLAALAAAGSSGGARPKAQLYLPVHDDGTCSTRFAAGSVAHLVKFTSHQLALGHEEGLCEAAYLTLAAQAGIDVPTWRLLAAPTQSGAQRWLALERFDTRALPDGREGRLQLHSACGLLDADFRMPSLDYEDLIKASSFLCQSPRAGQIQFRRALFNLFACNQDDHSKNWAFLQSDNGQWQPSPFYDATFSPSPYGEHATAFGGYGKQPPLKVIQQMASHANYANWPEAQAVINEVVAAINTFADVAHDLGVVKETITLITRQLNQAYQDNKELTQTIKN